MAAICTPPRSAGNTVPTPKEILQPGCSPEPPVVGGWERRALDLERRNGLLKAQLAERDEEIRKLKGRIAWLEQQLFGRKTEQSDVKPAQAPEPTEEGDGSLPPAGNIPRKRGKQRGGQGHGRKSRPDLPAQEVVHDLPEDRKRCPTCHVPFEPFPGTEDSEEIDWEVRLVRRVHRRKRYVAGCACGAVPGIVSAPPAPKLIPKGMFSCAFWVRIVLGKFLFQAPLLRARRMLALEGLAVSQGTLTGGLQRISELLGPLFECIVERNRTAKHWHMDETRWLVFADFDGKVGHRWWLWVAVTRDTCVFLIEPTRSAEVPKKHLGEDPVGILNVDRYAAYKSLGPELILAFCWSHGRRDFIRIGDGHPELREWARLWEEGINYAFDLNRERCKAPVDSAEFRQVDGELRDWLESMAQSRDAELADPSLPPVARKALESLRNHWEGFSVFVDHPEIPMENNEAERRIRNPVVGRKNCCGSGSVWSGQLAARAFTVIQTLLLNRLDPQRFLLAYFEACARNGGKPPASIEAWLPWNLSEEQKAAWGAPEGFS